LIARIREPHRRSRAAGTVVEDPGRELLTVEHDRLRDAGQPLLELGALGRDDILRWYFDGARSTVLVKQCVEDLLRRQRLSGVTGHQVLLGVRLGTGSG